MKPSQTLSPKLSPNLSVADDGIYHDERLISFTTRLSPTSPTRFGRTISPIKISPQSHKGFTSKTAPAAARAH